MTKILFRLLGVGLLIGLAACGTEPPPSNVSGPKNHTTNVRNASQGVGLKGLEAKLRIDVAYRIGKQNRRECQITRARATILKVTAPRVPIFMDKRSIVIKHGNVVAEQVSHSHQSSVPLVISASHWYPCDGKLTVRFLVHGVFRGQQYGFERTMSVPTEPLDGWPPIPTV